MSHGVQLDQAKIAGFCQRNHIRRLLLFGSVLTDRFGPDSDIDFLVEFEPGNMPGLFGIARMELELSDIIGRKADLVERCAVEASENYIRRRHILSSLEPVYVA